MLPNGDMKPELFMQSKDSAPDRNPKNCSFESFTSLIEDTSVNAAEGTGNYRLIFSFGCRNFVVPKGLYMMMTNQRLGMWLLRDN